MPTLVDCKRKGPPPWTDPKSSVSPNASSDNGSFKPIQYVYDQFSFDPLAEFQFPNPAGGTGKEVQYRRSFNHPYSKEIFSGDTPEDSDELQQLGRYGYFYFNHRNDVTSLLKHNGQSLHSYLYDEFGRMYDVNKRPQDSSNFTDPHNHYAFSSKEFDEESELSYFGARYYDASVGRWLTQDLYRGDRLEPETLHRYGFVKNNPINLIDIDGYFFHKQTWSAVSSAADFVAEKTVQAYEFTKEAVIDAGAYIKEKSVQAYEFTKKKAKSAYDYFAEEEEIVDELNNGPCPPKCGERVQKTSNIDIAIGYGKGFIKPFKGTIEMVIHPWETIKDFGSLLSTGGKLFLEQEKKFFSDPFGETQKTIEAIEEVTRVAKEEPERFKQELLYETVGGQLLLQKLEQCQKDAAGEAECFGEISGTVVEAVLLSKGLKIIEELKKVSKVAKNVKKIAKDWKITMLNPYELTTTQPLTLSKSKFNKLKADIKTNGIQESIKFVEYNGKKYVVDGHHRLRAAKELGIQNVPVEQVKLPYKGYKTVDDFIYSQY